MKTYNYTGRNVHSLPSLVFGIAIDEEMHKQIFDENNVKVTDTNLEQDLAGVDFYFNNHACNAKIASTGYITIPENVVKIVNEKPVLTYPNDCYISIYYNNHLCYLSAIQINNADLLQKSLHYSGYMIKAFEFYHVANDNRQSYVAYPEDSKYYLEQFKVYTELKNEGINDIDTIIARFQPLYKQYHHEEFTFVKQ